MCKGYDGFINPLKKECMLIMPYPTGSIPNFNFLFIRLFYDYISIYEVSYGMCKWYDGFTNPSKKECILILP